MFTLQSHNTRSLFAIVHWNKKQVHVVTCDSLWVRLWVWKWSSRYCRSTFQHSMFCLQMPSLLFLSACILYSPAKVNRRRFGALGAARLTHYSKCQLCKWSAVCLSSHIIWVIALWQPYLFWCSIHTSIAIPAISWMLSLWSGYRDHALHEPFIDIYM